MDVSFPSMSFLHSLYCPLDQFIVFWLDLVGFGFAFELDSLDLCERVYFSLSWRVCFVHKVVITNVCNQVFDPKFRESFPHVERYFMTMVNQPAFKKVMGDVELCKERMKKTGKDTQPSPGTLARLEFLS